MSSPAVGERRGFVFCHHVGADSRGKRRFVETDGEQSAAYRDDEGELHTVSAVRAHRACTVERNAGDGSWDCPCDVARFCYDGVLDAPASTPLPERESRDDKQTYGRVKAPPLGRFSLPSENLACCNRERVDPVEVHGPVGARLYGPVFVDSHDRCWPSRRLSRDCRP